MARRYMIFDYETYSEYDVTDVGGIEYARHQSTEIMCAAFAVGTREELKTAPVKLFVPPEKDGASHDVEFLLHLTNPDVILVAHNAIFEQCITKYVVPRYRNLVRAEDAANIPLERWLCTASLARAYGIPGKLADAAAALKMKNQKDMEGHRLMLKLSQPRKPTKNDPSTRHRNPDDFQRLYDYCLKDLEAERELFLRMPMLHKRERKFWLLNQKMNLRGFEVDRDLVLGALHCIDKEVTKLDRRFQKLTGLNSARQRDATLELLKTTGLELPNMRAETIDEILQKDIPEKARKILEIRQSISKSSTAKYQSFDIRTRSDGRSRDNTIYFGAHTGRDSGTGLQPQNLFKSVLPHKDVLTGIELIKARDVTAIEALYDKPMELFASTLRSCIVAPKGKILDVGDFSTIEVRVLFWLAKHTEGLAALASGHDLYIDMAAKIFQADFAEILEAYKSGDGDGREKRQLGKATVLGAGFGIGVNGEKFVQAAKTLAGLDISISLAQKCVAIYREENKPIPKFWNTIEDAATRAVTNPGKAYRHGFLTWRVEGDALTCELPIGRKLFYYKPRLERVQGLWGEQLKLTYMSVAGQSRKFIRVSTWGGKLTENVVQAVARDLLMEAALRLEERGHRPVLLVHDEIVSERNTKSMWAAKAGDGTEMFKIMAEVPAWAEGLPIKVEGWSETRYRK